jgi:hypothetical protein
VNQFEPVLKKSLVHVSNTVYIKGLVQVQVWQNYMVHFGLVQSLDIC